MMATHYQRVAQAFQQAIAVRGEGPRNPHDLGFAAIGAEDPGVLAEGLALLSDHDAIDEPPPAKSAKPTRASTFLDPGELHGWRYAGGGGEPRSLLAEWGASAVGQRVGDFTLIGELGTGG